MEWKVDYDGADDELIIGSLADKFLRDDLRRTQDLEKYEYQMQEDWNDPESGADCSPFSDVMGGIAPIPMWTIKDCENDLIRFRSMCDMNRFNLGYSC